MNQLQEPGKIEKLCKHVESAKTLLGAVLVVVVIGYLIFTGSLLNVADQKLEEVVGVKVERFESITNPRDTMFLSMQEVVRRETGVTPTVEEFSQCSVDETKTKIRWEPQGQPYQEYLYERTADGGSHSRRLR